MNFYGAKGDSSPAKSSMDGKAPSSPLQQQRRRRQQGPRTAEWVLSILLCLSILAQIVLVSYTDRVLTKQVNSLERMMSKDAKIINSAANSLISAASEYSDGDGGDNDADTEHQPKPIQPVQDGEAGSDGPPSTSEMDSPIIIFTFRRANYLHRALTAIWDHHPANKAGDRRGEGGRMAYPIVVSQDGNDGEVRHVVDEFREKFRGVGVPVVHAVHQRAAGEVRGTNAYKALAVHYGWALRRLFAGEIYRDDASGQGLPPPQRVIILEEDIEVAPDFFSFMNSVASLLDSDPTLLAASAYNDNGKKGEECTSQCLEFHSLAMLNSVSYVPPGLVGDTRRLTRSDFFPGLGWMITRTIWEEMRPKWPG